LTSKAARDVTHEVILVDGNITETVVDIARKHRVDYIYLSSQANSPGGHDITTAILENSDIPVVVIDENRE
jgi:F420-dependent methylenetetrahydromethanopterin dehydrogenase